MQSDDAGWRESGEGCQRRWKESGEGVSEVDVTVTKTGVMAGSRTPYEDAQHMRIMVGHLERHAEQRAGLHSSSGDRDEKHSVVGAADWGPETKR